MSISYRVTNQGAYELSTFFRIGVSPDEQYLSRQYFGYTKKEATQMFRAELREIKAGK